MVLIKGILKKNRIYLASSVLLMGSGLFFLYECIRGLGYLTFGDESGHFLGAISIHYGDRLYKDYIDAHGPVIFMFSWLMGQLVGFHEVWLLRLVSIFCAVGATASIFYSSLFVFLWQRFLAVALWLGLLSSVWVVQGLYLNSYWTVGGALSVIVMSGIVLPLLFDRDISRITLFISGCSLALLPFTAYPFSIIAFLFFIIVIGIWFIHIRNNKDIPIFLMGGCLFTVFIMLAWLLVYGDIGGMIAYHFIINQYDYIHYTSLGLKEFYQSLFPSLLPEHIIESLAVVAFFIGSLLTIIYSRYKVSSVLFLLAILTLQLRGSFFFQNGAFLMVALALIACMVSTVLASKPKEACYFTVFSIILVYVISWQALSSPAGNTVIERSHIRWYAFKKSNETDFRVIRYYTRPDERILVIPYNPDVYIFANRLAIEKYHAYLPWEADYAKHPWHGYQRDICVDLPNNLPPVIYYDHLVVWGSYHPEQYMACVMKILENHYVRLTPTSFIYIRNDRYREGNFNKE